jgi:acyl transferase domain-containing protein
MNNFETTNSSGPEPIAVVGIGCRLPGGISGPEEFWNLLQQGKDVFTNWSQERIPFSGNIADGEAQAQPFRGAYLSDIARFDADFFNISPREAEAMDPQQRLLLEVAWESMEDAGWSIERLRNTQAGVFVGAMGCDYSSLYREHQSLTPYSALGFDTSLIANRVSYFLGLQGPSLTINTASSSSLVAVHLACQSLRAGEIETALVGGVNLILNLSSSKAMEQMGVLSPDGRARAFMVDARGYVRGEGIVCVALKTLTRALADRDRIYCLISGSAVNNNGAHIGIAAPSRTAQVQLLEAAYLQADIQPGQVQYVEAHGSGTVAGDATELEALTKYFGQERAIDSPLLIGTVKNNIGHLEAAAGIAGLIKTALAIFYRKIPGSRIDGQLSPAINNKSSPLRLLKRSESWSVPGKVAIAGVSSFGYGGTNCHVVLSGTVSAGNLQEAAEFPRKVTLIQGDVHPQKQQNKARLIPISACSWQAFAEFAQAAALTLENKSAESVFRDWTYTAALRRTHHHLRKAILADSCAELRSKLAALSAAPNFDPYCASAVPTEVILWLNESETEWWNPLIDASLLENSIYRQRFEECAAIVRQKWGWKLEDNLVETGELSPETKQTVCALLHWARYTSLLELAKAMGLQTEDIISSGIGTIIAEHLTGILSTSDAAQRVIDWSAARLNSQPDTTPQLTEKYSWFTRERKELEKERRQILVTVNDLAGTKKEIAVQAQNTGVQADAPVIVLQNENAFGRWAILTALGEIYEKGGSIDWRCQYADESGQLIPLPLYKWQGRPHWLIPKGVVDEERGHHFNTRTQ